MCRLGIGNLNTCLDGCFFHIDMGGFVHPIDGVVFGSAWDIGIFDDHTAVVRKGFETSAGDTTDLAIYFYVDRIGHNNYLFYI